MSTIRVDNFGPSAGGTTYSARGIAKAWVNFNGTGTIAARDSENVSSLVDDGTGLYTANLTNAFSAADYAMSGAAKGIAATAAGSLSENINVARTASAMPVSVTRTDTGASYDDTQVNFSCHGDLA
jgi:hypothetical protein